MPSHAFRIYVVTRFGSWPTNDRNLPRQSAMERADQLNAQAEAMRQEGKGKLLPPGFQYYEVRAEECASTFWSAGYSFGVTLRPA